MISISTTLSGEIFGRNKDIYYWHIAIRQGICIVSCPRLITAYRYRDIFLLRLIGWKRVPCNFV